MQFRFKPFFLTRQMLLNFCVMIVICNLFLKLGIEIMHPSLISSKCFQLVFISPCHYITYLLYVIKTIKFIQIYNYLYFPHTDRNLFPPPPVRSFEGFQLTSVFKTANIVKSLEGVSVHEKYYKG